jgi:succinoglycan biosynthesis transport protein ExoP
MSEGTEITRRPLPARPDVRFDDARRRPAGDGVPAPALRGSASASGDGDGIDLREILAVIRRRLPVILGSVILITLCAAGYVSQLVPRYSAEAWVMLNTQHVRLGVEDMMSGLEVDGAVVRSEMDLLKSYPLAEKVAKQLHLEKEPEFNGRLRKPEFGDYVRHPLGFVLSLLRRLTSRPHPHPAVTETQDGEYDHGVVWSLMGHVSVSTDGRSYLLRIHAQSESPQLAAKIANAYAQIYLLDQLELKYDAVRRTSAWLNGHLAQMRDKVRESENAVELFKQQHNITETRAGTVTAQQLTEVNTELVAAAADRAQKEASLHALQQQEKSGGAVSGVALNSPLLQQLREEQAQLLQRQAQLATRYKPEHPTMVNLRAELQDVAHKIQEETAKAVAVLQSDVAVARAREAALRETMAKLQQSTDQQDQASIQLRELEREAEANKVLYENFLSKFKQTSAQEDIQQPDARLVAPAIPPTAPSYPDKMMLMGMAVVVSAFIGLVLAFLLERLDNGFRAGEQVEQELGIRTLGLVPAVERGGAAPHQLVVEEPKALYSEAVRSVRTALRYTKVDQPPKLVLVTSSLPGEGKTVFALSMARSVARSGGRALLIDCDLRRPGVARLTGCDTPRNLLDLFDGAEPDTLIVRDRQSGIDVIPAKSGTANPQDLLGSQRMQDFLAAMRTRYDLIVLDAPPALIVSDPLVLSHIVDTTLFLVRWEKSTRKKVTQGLRRLQAEGANVAGAVITRVNPRRHARYGYGDSVYYYYYSDYQEVEASGNTITAP